MHTWYSIFKQIDIATTKQILCNLPSLTTHQSQDLVPGSNGMRMRQLMLADRTPQ